MRIAILGATGNLGSHALTAAIEAGHSVVAYARRPEAVQQRDGVTAVGGELDDTAALTAAVAGTDALIVSLTGTMKDKTFTQRTLPGILTAARDGGVGRVVLVSAFGAGDTATKASPFARLIYRTALKGFFDDKATAEQLLPASGVPHTVVYPVNLKEAAAKESAAIEPLDQVSRVPGLPTLPFANAGRALVTIATNPATEGQRLLVTTATGWKPVER